jgi:hypothetical protein
MDILLMFCSGFAATEEATKRCAPFVHAAVKPVFAIS